MPDPLHPAVVHFPIVLAVLVPLFAVWALVRDRRSVAEGGAWTVVVVLCAALVATAYLSVNTGGAQEERVERAVPHSAIHEHEESAERMLIVSIVCFLASLGGLASGRVGRAGRVSTLVAAILLVPVAGVTGHLGGQLVYQHGAASAYTTNAGPGGADQASGNHERQDDDDR